MANHINSVTIQGALLSLVLKDGKASITLANNRYRKLADGSFVQIPAYLHCRAFSRSAVNALSSHKLHDTITVSGVLTLDKSNHPVIEIRQVSEDDSPSPSL